MVTRVLLIAEAGVNHNGRLGLAEQLVDVAAGAGADFVKFQTFNADRLASATAPKAEYQTRQAGAEETQVEMLRHLELSESDLRALIDRAAARGIRFLSSPFDEESADLLIRLGLQALKIPSGELTNCDYLRHLARFHCPLFLSTGMATLGEVEAAVDVLRGEGCGDLSLLHCVTNYPADFAEVNLHAMDTMRQAFGLPVGYSDHTTGIAVALAAAACGAAVIEKHFTVDRTLPGPDHAASLEPDELTALVVGVRQIEEALGDGIKRPTPAEVKNRLVVRKSLVAARDLVVGQVLVSEDLAVKRPGSGLAPSRRAWVLGRALRRAKRRDEVLTDDDV